jgi:hypothetical protein
MTLMVAPFPGAMASGSIARQCALVTSFMAVAVLKNAPKPDVSTAAVKQVCRRTIDLSIPISEVPARATEAITKLELHQIITKSKVPNGGGPVQGCRWKPDIGRLYLSEMLPNKDITIAGFSRRSAPDCGLGHLSKATDRAREGICRSHHARGAGDFQRGGFQPRSS